MRREDREDAFGDACYRAWQRGLDPDQVDRDRFDQRFDDTDDREVAIEAELRYLARRERGVRVTISQEKG